jgi:hypothetical protein
MKTAGTKWVVCTAILAAGCQWAQAATTPTKAERAQAERLIEQTLQLEASDGVDDRSQLLRPVLEQKYPCDKAYWLSGFVYDMKRKEWLTIDETRLAVAEDKLLAKYRKMRATSPESEMGQTRLARWCMKQRLDDQARAHWTRVLSLNPDNAEARLRLGFCNVNGTWVSQQEIVDARTRAYQYQTAIARWAPKVSNLVARMNGTRQRTAESARQELASIKDPEAVPAIEFVLCAKGGDSALLGIQLLNDMKAAEAAQALAWHAVCSPWKPVRMAATAALKNQRPHDYMPLLLGSLRSPILARFTVLDAPDGTLLMRRAIYQENTEEQRLSIVDASQRPELLRTNTTVNSSTLRTNPAALREYNRLSAEDRKRQQEDIARARARALAEIRKQEWTLSAKNMSINSWNSRVSSVLTEVTGDSQPTTPGDWYSWWNQYNEIPQEGEKYFRLAYRSGVQPIVTVGRAPQLRMTSCLVAGTPIWTESGSVPVEQVRMGDRVFACNCETGELMLKPVVKTIINPKKETLRLRTKNDTLNVTGGHTFWVSGQGWVKARELRPETRLHTAKGTVDLKQVELADTQDTYNLVVADFHTYFVGKEQILTYDNTIRKPTNCVVPGLPAHLAAKYP